MKFNQHFTYKKIWRASVSPIVMMMFNSVGFMFGTGGSALIAKTLGEKNKKEANEIFSSLIWCTLIK